MTPKLKKIILVIVGLVVLFIVYAVFLKPAPENPSLINGTGGVTATSQDARALGNQIAQALLRIEQITLDKSIFNDSIYRSLQDRSQPISDEPIGRTNPFAPIGQNSASVSTQTASSSAGTLPSMQTRTPATSSATPPASTGTTTRPNTPVTPNPAAAN